MNALKKILPLLLVLTLSVGVVLLTAACKKNPPDEPDTPDTPAEKKNFAITVLDDKGNPVEGATLNIYDANVTKKATAVTNAGGVVMLELEVAAYNIVVDAPTGYTAEPSYALAKGLTTLTITLKKVDTRPVYTVTVKDMEGNPVPGLLVQLCVTGGGCVLGAATDANGTSAVQVPAVDDYYVSFPNMADFPQFLFEEKYYFEDCTQTITVTLYPNNVPDGTAERPFVFTGEPYTLTLAAGTTAHFVAFGVYNCDFTATGFAGGKLTCGTLVATAEADGTLACTMPMPGVNDMGNTRVQFALENTGSAAATVTFQIKSKPGTSENPIAVTDLSAPVVAEIKKGMAVYYTYTATAAGTFTVSCSDNRNDISLNNLTSGKYGDATNGAATATMTVAVGDTVQIVVGAKPSEDQNDMTLTLHFALSGADASGSDPVAPDLDWN